MKVHTAHTVHSVHRRRPAISPKACAFAAVALAALAAAAGAQPRLEPVRLQPSREAVFASPTRLAPGPDAASLVVSDYQRRSVLVLDRRGLSLRRELTVAGRPLAVAALEGRIYVGNETTGKVEVLNPTGKHLFDLEGAIEGPADIAADRERRRLFVADSRAGEIKVFDRDGSLLYSFGGGGEGAPLVSPTGVALDPERREVLVSDFGDPVQGVPARVQIFSELGEHLGTISGKNQNRPFRFSRPQGLAVDGRGHIFVVDSLLGQVLVFDRESRLGVAALGSYGEEPGQLLLPLDVLLDADTGDLVVTSNRSGRVEVLREGGLLP